MPRDTFLVKEPGMTWFAIATRPRRELVEMKPPIIDENQGVA